MLFWTLLPLALAAQSGDEFFEKKIRPVLVEKCYACHGSKTAAPMGGLRVDSAEGLRKGGDTGPAVVPKEPEKSLLLKAIRYSDLNLRMPPTGKLTDGQIADFEEWIRQGAADPRAATAQAPAARQGIDWAEARKHWAFRPIRKPAVPEGPSPVDAFLSAKGMKLSPAADKRVWLRRVTFDLTGLPPTRAEIAEYLGDTSGGADRKVVERLLASPQYGERWARHWLDLVRFAETNGHEFDNDKLDAWRYRDYVIRAFNEDVPYTQFVKEHLAGDLLAARVSKDGAHLESPLGTSWMWFGEVLNSATDSVKSRADMVDNQIDVMGKTFLGLTTACARCHDHKFDPIPTADYYGLAGIFHSTYVREAVIDSPQRAAQIATVSRRFPSPAKTPAAAVVTPREGDVIFESEWTATGQAFGPAPGGVFDSRAAGSDQFVGSLTSRKFKMPKLWVHVRMGGSAQDKANLRVTVVADDHKSEHFYTSGKPGMEWKTLRMTKEIGRTCYFEIVDRSRSGHIAVERIVLSDSETPPRVETEGSGRAMAISGGFAQPEPTVPESAFGMIAKEEDPHDVKLHIRGSHQNLGAEVPRHFLQLIAGEKQPPIERGSGRLELAGWVAAESNPLMARVMVNRIWKHHFGQGIVRSADNFGKLGDAPSDPALLDYLAAEFGERGWSVKQMHRLIVLSAAYRRADFPVRRLEAEAIRDSVLAVSGRLDKTLYGPGVTPHISRYQEGRGKPASGPLDGNARRSLYIQVRRNFLTPMFLAFDYPLPVSTMGARGSSTVPSQALMMMNNEFVAGQARLWARRAIASESDTAKRVDSLFEEAYGRVAEDWERQESLRFLTARPGGEEQAWTDLCHVLFNSTEFVYVR